ncbi:unnamed protein product, partial [Oppiella nova]
KGNTQTVYVIAVAFELLPQNLIPLAANHLVDNIKAHDWHLTTGFVGVGYLCPTLSRLGHSDVAYRLLLQDTYPSWGYSIKYNATTIWERWDGWTQEKGFQDPAMNSFNHYSLGSVGVGFKSIVIAPKPGGNLHKMAARYQSINGLIGMSWETNGANITLTIDIPVNTKAFIDLSFLKQPLHTNVGSGSWSVVGVSEGPVTKAPEGEFEHPIWVPSQPSPQSSHDKKDWTLFCSGSGQKILKPYETTVHVINPNAPQPHPPPGQTTHVIRVTSHSVSGVSDKDYVYPTNMSHIQAGFIFGTVMAVVFVIVIVLLKVFDTKSETSVHMVQPPTHTVITKAPPQPVLRPVVRPHPPQNLIVGLP